jgi:formylmethanofuran dehydrogenase subunit C
MFTARSSVWTSLLIALFVVSTLGCASSGVPKPIGAQEMPMLAGKWSGMLTLPTSTAVPGTLTLSPDGTYSAEAGAFMAQGKATIKDGTLNLMATSKTGGLSAIMGDSSSSASLTERSGGTLVLTGYGKSERGPFYFEVTKPK